MLRRFLAPCLLLLSACCLPRTFAAGSCTLAPRVSCEQRKSISLCDVTSWSGTAVHLRTSVGALHGELVTDTNCTCLVSIPRDTEVRLTAYLARKAPNRTPPFCEQFLSLATPDHLEQARVCPENALWGSFLGCQQQSHSSYVRYLTRNKRYKGAFDICLSVAPTVTFNVSCGIQYYIPESSLIRSTASNGLRTTTTNYPWSTKTSSVANPGPTANPGSFPISFTTNRNRLPTNIPVTMTARPPITTMSYPSSSSVAGSTEGEELAPLDNGETSMSQWIDENPGLFTGILVFAGLLLIIIITSAVTFYLSEKRKKVHIRNSLRQSRSRRTRPHESYDTLASSASASTYSPGTALPGPNDANFKY